MDVVPPEEGVVTLIEKLKQLYTIRSPKHPERAATIAPLSAQARALRDEHAALLAAHSDVAHQVVTLDTKALARYAAPALMPDVYKLVASAKAITGAGSTDGAMEAVRRVEAGIDRNTDNEYERNAQDARKQIDLLAGAVAELRRHAAALAAALDALAVAPTLVSPEVIVPKSEVTFMSATSSPTSVSA